MQRFNNNIGFTIKEFLHSPCVFVGSKVMGKLNDKQFLHYFLTNEGAKRSGIDFKC